MQPDFSVLDAYSDLWQQLALGRRVNTAFVDGLLSFAPYRQSLEHYQATYAISPSDMRCLLLSLGDIHSGCDRPELQVFWQANKQAVQQIGYYFDIIFPLRRLNLQHALSQAGVASSTVPYWLRIQPELLQQPYLVQDALVVDFFSLRIDPAGHLTIDGMAVADYVVAVLRERE